MAQQRGHDLRVEALEPQLPGEVVAEVVPTAQPQTQPDGCRPDVPPHRVAVIQWGTVPGPEDEAGGLAFSQPKLKVCRERKLPSAALGFQLVQRAAVQPPPHRKHAVTHVLVLERLRLPW